MQTPPADSSCISDTDITACILKSDESLSALNQCKATVTCNSTAHVIEICPQFTVPFTSSSIDASHCLSSVSDSTSLTFSTSAVPSLISHTKFETDCASASSSLWHPVIVDVRSIKMEREVDNVPVSSSVVTKDQLVDDALSDVSGTSSCVTPVCSSSSIVSCCSLVSLRPLASFASSYVTGRAAADRNVSHCIASPVVKQEFSVPVVGRLSSVKQSADSPEIFVSRSAKVADGDLIDLIDQTAGDHSVSHCIASPVVKQEFSVPVFGRLSSMKQSADSPEIFVSRSAKVAGGDIIDLIDQTAGDHSVSHCIASAVVKQEFSAPVVSRLSSVTVKESNHAEFSARNSPETFVSRSAKVADGDLIDETADCSVMQAVDVGDGDHDSLSSSLCSAADETSVFCKNDNGSRKGRHLPSAVKQQPDTKSSVICQSGKESKLLSVTSNESKKRKLQTATETGIFLFISC